MKVTLPKYNGSYCQNCGHPSHCGGPLYLEVKDYGVNSEPYNIKACSCCRCKSCEKSISDAKKS